MNKEEFITQLKQSISILDDQEQQYFVEEYTQHIDMKMSQGMSEEEAVKEIGSIEELSKEILESYHVRTDRAESRSVKNVDYGKFFGKVRAQVDKIYEKIASGCKKLAVRVKNFFARHKRKEGERMDAGQRPEEGQKRGTESGTAEKRGCGFWLGRMISGFFHFCGTVIRKCFYIALWCLVALWNCFAVFCGLIGIFILILCVFMLGMFVVMLAQGYPFIGLTIATLGATIAVGALTVVCFALTQRKINVGEKPEGGEANA